MTLLARLLYRSLLWLLFPLVLVLLYWPRSGKPGYGARWREHFGWVDPPAQTAPLWLHAVSLGEVVAAIPLIRAFKARHPEVPLLVTTTTRTGADALAVLGDLVEHRYAPLDYPGAVRRFLRRVRPGALLVMEVELWPHRLLACQQQRIPVVLLNARLSQSSCRRYQRLMPLFSRILPGLAGVLCQSADDARRFAALGVPQKRLLVTGSIKFDLRLPEDTLARGRALRQRLGEQRPVWIAASTHQGEDAQVLEAHTRILTSMPDALLILVPRHPQRFDGVFQLCQARGFQVVRRSAGHMDDDSETMTLYLGDTMGELALLYAAADVAFVGGSLVPVGGHNLLEPAALARPVLTGPYYINFGAITETLAEAGAVRVIADSAQLAEAVVTLFDSPDVAAAMGERGAAMVAQNRGALDRTLAELLAILSLQ